MTAHELREAAARLLAAADAEESEHPTPEARYARAVREIEEMERKEVCDVLAAE